MAKKLKGGWWKDMGLFMCNMKPCIFHNESKNFLNIVKCNPFPTMKSLKKVSPKHKCN